MILLLSVPHVSGITQYLCCDWLLSLSIISSSLTHVVAYWRIFFFLRIFFLRLNIHCIVYTILFYSSIVGHLGCFHVLAIVNNVPVNMEIQIFNTLLSVFVYIPRSGIGGSYSNFICNFLRNRHMFYTAVNTILHAHTPIGHRVQFLHIFANAYFFFFIVTIHNGCEVVDHVNLLNR